MDLETVVKIEGYSVEYQEENDTGDAQSYEIKPAVSVTGLLLPGLCGSQNNDSTSTTAITFHPRIFSASRCERIVNAGESPLTITKDVKVEATAEEKFNCFKSFGNIQKLNGPLKNEHSQNSCECDLCGRAFTSKSSLEKHLATHSNVRPFLCSICFKSFTTIPDLTMHELKVHTITQIETQIAGSEKQPPFQRSESVKIVMLTPTLIPILPKTKSTLHFSFEAIPPEDVELSSKLATEKSSKLVNNQPDPLKQPEKTKMVKKNRRKEETRAKEKYKCSIPNYSQSFANKWKLQAHLKNKHSQNWLLKCPLCGKLCSKKSALESHLVSHSTARPHNCNACSKSFKHIHDFRKHERKAHQISSSSTEKRELSKDEPDLLLKPQSQISSTPTTPNLPDSINKIETEIVLADMTTAPVAPLLKFNPTNKCDVCLKVFKSRPALSNHKSQVHTAENEKRYKCHVCAKPSLKRSILKQHLYFVHGEKSENLKIFECEFCQRQFSSVSRLEIHVVDKHVVDKEFECLECFKTFMDHEVLTKHQVKIHEHTTRHFCDVCSAGFTSRNNLAGHVKNIHHKLYCKKCVRSFENKSEFNQHLNSEATNNLNAKLKFKCQVCCFSLSTQCNFNIHVDGHSREDKSTVVP